MHTMAKIDAQKEKIATIRVFVVMFMTIFSMGAYIFNNFGKINELKLILSVIGAIFFLSISLFFSLALNKEIKKLEEL